MAKRNSLFTQKPISTFCFPKKMSDERSKIDAVITDLAVILMTESKLLLFFFPVLFF